MLPLFELEAMFEFVFPLAFMFLFLLFLLLVLAFMFPVSLVVVVLVVVVVPVFPLLLLWCGQALKKTANDRMHSKANVLVMELPPWW